MVLLFVVVGVKWENRTGKDTVWVCFVECSVSGCLRSGGWSCLVYKAVVVVVGGCVLAEVCVCVRVRGCVFEVVRNQGFGCGRFSVGRDWRCWWCFVVFIFSRCCVRVWMVTLDITKLTQQNMYQTKRSEFNLYQTKKPHTRTHKPNTKITHTKAKPTNHPPEKCVSKPTHKSQNKS